MERACFDSLLEKYHVQPVGGGYIDCICPMKNVKAFIEEMSRLGVRTTGFTWWCHVCGGHRPCGMGGPKARYERGFYSEMEMGKALSFSSNEEMENFL